MKILFIVHGYKPAWRLGGPINSVSSLAENLVKLGHQVTVFTTNSNLDEILDVPLMTPVLIDGVEVYYFPCFEFFKKYLPGIKYFSQSMGILYSPSMKEYLHKFVQKFDVIHSHLPFIYPTMVAAHAAFKVRKPFFYHQRGVLDPERLKFRYLKKKIYISLVERNIMLNATMLFALTSAERENYRKLGINTQCRIIPNGIDLPCNLSEAPLDYEWLKSIGIHQHHKVILFIGRLHPIKGAQRLVEAFFKYAKNDSTAYLVMAGPDEANMSKEFLLKAQNLKLDNRLRFTGMIHGSLKNTLFRRANLFCLPSDAEGFSMAILEALSYSLPVMISPGCNFDEVEAYSAGWIVGKNETEIYHGLNKCLSDENELRFRGANARNLAKRYNWNLIAKEYVTAYEEGIIINCSNRQKNSFNLDIFTS